MGVGSYLHKWIVNSIRLKAVIPDVVWHRAEQMETVITGGHADKETPLYWVFTGRQGGSCEFAVAWRKDSLYQSRVQLGKWCHCVDYGRRNLL